MSDPRKNIALFVSILGVVLFSAKAIIIKLAYQYDIDPLSLLLLRMLFSLPVYIAVLIFTKAKKSNKESTKFKDYLGLILAGMLGYYVASYLDFKGLALIKASLERIILFIYPTIVVILSFFFLGKRITKLQIISILITYVGIIVTFAAELEIERSDKVILGAFFIFISAVTYAIYLVSSTNLIARFGTIKFTAYAMIVSCICVSLHFLIQTGGDDLLNYPSVIYTYAILMSVFCTVIPSFMVSYGIKHLGASNFAVIGGLGPISTIFLAYLFLGELMTISQIFGTILVIAGVYIISKEK